MVIFQVDPMGLDKFLGMGTKEVTLIGVLLIISITLSYILKESHKTINRLHEKISDQQEKRITEAKDFSGKVSELGIKFIEQTHKLLLVLEMLKGK